MDHTRFVGLDIHKERISVAVAESEALWLAVEYLGEISNDAVAIDKLCERLARPGRSRWRLATKLGHAAMAFIASSGSPRPSVQRGGVVTGSEEVWRSSED